MNLVNSKSSGLDVLFQMISCLKYRELEVDIKVYNPKYDYYHFFHYQTYGLGQGLGVYKKRLKETFLLHTQNIMFLCTVSKIV